MNLENLRDFAMYAAIFGTFTLAWFGWAQENPPQKLRLWLGIGSVLGAIVASIGIFLAIKNWNGPTTFNTPGMYEFFGIVAALEVLLIVAGALVLRAKKKTDYIASWVAFVVAIHFAPLAIIFNDPWLFVLSGLTTVAALSTFFVKPDALIRRNTLACILMGSILLVFAVRGILLCII